MVFHIPEMAWRGIVAGLQFFRLRGPISQGTKKCEISVIWTLGMRQFLGLRHIRISRACLYIHANEVIPGLISHAKRSFTAVSNETSAKNLRLHYALNF